MPVTTDIAATWRGPGRVMRRHLARGESEPRALVFLMGACLLIFVAQWPRLAREAYIDDSIPLDARLAGALAGWVFFAPIFFYALAWIGHLLARLFGGQGSAYGSRLALFWALLASSPAMLLLGLTLGFVGAGPAAVLVSVIWAAALFWFWFGGMRVVHGREDLPA